MPAGRIFELSPPVFPTAVQACCGNRRAIVQNIANQKPEPTMSIFAVNYLCREVLRDHAFRAAMKADPAKALAPLDLTDEERRALIAGDVGTLYRMGVNGFLMGYLARYEVCGLNVEIYNQRMRAVKVDELGQPVA
jgi:Aromatic-ring-opening dioxygenase LigAB, LigA subunit